MYETGKTLLSILSDQGASRVPVWLMRQAGRYLPEYREIRQKADGFIDFCLTPELAAEATLQPLRRFDLDAAILFADILLIPHALGLPVRFDAGAGPLLEPIEGRAGIEALTYRPDILAPVYETLRRVKPQLDARQTLIGFCGGAWTVACYMIEGRGKNDFAKAKSAASDHPALLDALIQKIEEASFLYLSNQIEAGADVLQIFESHAGQLSGASFHRFVIEPTARLVQRLKEKYPDVPLIGFPRGASLADYETYARETRVACLGLDQHVPLDFARDRLMKLCCLQGNLSPDLLLEGGEAMHKQTQKILEYLSERLIFNLGHGVPKETNPAHIAALIEQVHAWEKK